MRFTVRQHAGNNRRASADSSASLVETHWLFARASKGVKAHQKPTIAWRAFSPKWTMDVRAYISSIIRSSMLMPAVGISAQAVPTAAIMSSLVKTVCTAMSPLTTAASAASTMALMSSDVAMS